MQDTLSAVIQRTCSSVQRCGLEIINIMNNDATLNAAAGAYEGLDRFKARKQLWADMKVRHSPETRLSAHGRFPEQCIVAYTGQ